MREFFYNLFSMRQPTFYAAVFGIIRDTEWKILMIKRKNTGFRDGYFALPAWHIEVGETPTEAMIKELKEEVWIELTEKDIKIIHIGHRFSPQETSHEVRQYFSFFFEIIAYKWIPYNAEPEKSEWIYWINWKLEEKIQFRDIFEKIENKEPYSELDERK